MTAREFVRAYMSGVVIGLLAGGLAVAVGLLNELLKWMGY